MQSSFFSGIFSYRDRVGRLEYLIGLVCSAVLSIIVNSVFSFAFVFSFPTVAGTNFFGIVLSGLCAIVFNAVLIIIVSFFIIKRFHDIGKSGAWWFALLIPVYNLWLGIGLLTEQGTVGPNQYGDDSLPPATVRDDAVHRFSQNKTARGGVLVVLLIVSLWGIGNGVRERVSERQQMDNLISQTMQNTVPGTSIVATSSNPELVQPQDGGALAPAPYHPASSSPAAKSTENQVQNPIAKTVAINTSDWKTQVVDKPSSSTFLTEVIPSVCYTIKYPSQLIARTETVEDFGTMYFKDPSAHSSGLMNDGVKIDLAQSAAGATADAVMRGSPLYLMNGDAQIKKLTTVGGLKGEALIPKKGIWTIYIDLPEKDGNVVLVMGPASFENIYDVNIAQAMAISITPSCTVP